MKEKITTETPEISSTVETPVETIEYRGYSVPVYTDDYSQSYYCVVDGEEIGLGTYNFDYKSDVEYIIDSKLDIIHRFDPPYHGAILEWFFNGYGNRDIRLVYRTRAIKIWLVEDADKVNLEKLKEESNIILDKIIRINS